MRLRVRLAVPFMLAAGALAAVGAISPLAAAAKGGPDKSHPYRHGTVPTRSSPQIAASTTDLNFGGGVSGVGVTTGAPRVYVVFWGSQWGAQSTNAQGNVTLSGDPNGMAPDFQAFMKGLGTAGELWSGVMTQYCEGVATGSQTCPSSNTSHVGYPTGGALAGVWVDESAAAPSQASGNQLAQEAVSAAGHFGNTNSTANRSAQYVIISPTGTHPDGFNTISANWCAWHDYSADSTLSGGAASSPYGPVAFTNLPYITDMGSSCGQNFVNSGSAGTLDGVTIVGGHEYAETITDQFPAGGWTDSSGNENGDKCAWISSGQGASQNVSLSTGSFAVQSTWANDFNGGAGGCEVSHPIVTNGGTNDFSISVSPASQSVTQGSSTTYTVSTAVTSGSPVTVSLSASGLPSGASASFNPASVTSGSSSTLTVTTASSTPAGSSTLTITGTSGSTSHSTTATLTVTAPVSNDFSIGVSPSSQTVTAGSSTTYTVSTAVTSGSATTVNLSASGLPSGATASFNPASVTAGGSSTLTVATTSATAAGSYTFTISGSNGSTSHSTTAGLTVTAAGGNPNLIANGGFETGTLSGWISSGASTGISTTAHSGSYSARAGTTTPTNGDSSIAQTFSVPATGSYTLTFWYRVVCPDTVTYDWATASLHDNTSGTTTTLLGKTCTNTGTWASVSAGLGANAGHSVTLTLTSHDDNYSSDPTYTLYDDVATAVAAPNPVVNGGFETGSLSGWTASGAAAGVSTTAHSGSYSARLGSTSPTNGDSSIAQTFTVPAGATKLSFWYDVVCPDTVTYDWATATLHDNTSGTTTTLLAKTCVSNSGWVQVSYGVSGITGHSVTLTLTSHDDNYTGDPTYTLYDDVVVG